MMPMQSAVFRRALLLAVSTGCVLVACGPRACQAPAAQPQRSGDDAGEPISRGGGKGAPSAPAPTSPPQWVSLPTGATSRSISGMALLGDGTAPHASFLVVHDN